MKKLIKVVLPPFIGFLLYFLGIRYSPDYFNLSIGQIGAGTLAGFMAFYKYSLPLLFVVAVLTQLLIVIPIWNKVIPKEKRGKKRALVFLILVCWLFAAGISYLIWDRQTGVHHLVATFIFLSAVQLVYWAINLFTLIMIE